MQISLLGRIKMSRFIDLCGTWHLTCNDSPIGKIDLEGRVPGCVHTDLIENKVIENIFYRDNSKKIQWIENCDFTYTKKFTVDSLSDNAYLEFDGLDTYADIYLNGTKLGEVDDMFIPHEFCADGVLLEGENTLEIRFFSPIKRVEGLPLYAGAFTRERMNTRRVQCTYSWDWVDRFVTMGIYRPARLAFREKNEIDNVYVYTHDVNPYSAQVKIEIELRDFADCGDVVHIEIRDPDGNVVLSKDRVAFQKKIYDTVDIANARLWYPVGYGEQPLYTVTVTSPTSKKVEKIGIRKVTILQIEDPEGSEYKNLSLELQKLPHLAEFDKNTSPAGFIILVNNIKIMCKGGDWVPCDPFPSEESPEKITRLLEMSVAGGVNMIRIWGGGIFERDEFYTECDRLGILVSQDFLMACGTYPEHEEWFIKALNRETRAAALRLRNRACLVYWCGDNENAVYGTENTNNFPGYRSATFGAEPILRELDPHRCFLASSPYGGELYGSGTRGTSHVTSYLGDIFPYIENTDMKNYRNYFDRMLTRFCCEYPAFGMSFASSLEKYMTNEDVFGDDKMEMLEFHTKNNPYLGTTLFDTYLDMAQKVFGEFSSGEDRIRKYQLVHCETIRLSMELYRRNKGYSWGLTYWMLNDCWPAAAGWSLIDYYACPKPAYYTFMRSTKPVIAALSEKNGKFSLHVCNDALQGVTGNAKLYVHDFKENCDVWVKSIAFNVNENASEKIFECDFAELDALLNENTVILCDLESDLGCDRALFVKDRFSDLAIEFTTPVIVSEDENEYVITTENFNPYVVLDVPYLLSDNCFTLKAGEKKTVKKIMTL